MPEARGDRMCQDAIQVRTVNSVGEDSRNLLLVLQELKMAIKASGEHKQRVIIHIAVDGLKIRDEKTGVRFHNI